MLSKLTTQINAQIKKTADTERDRLPGDLIESLENESMPFELEETDEIEQLENRMTQTLSRIERILGEAFSQALSKGLESQDSGFTL